MAEIVLSTLNAKYIHSAFGLRYLMANLGPLQARARLLEFDIGQRPLDIVEAVLAESPRIAAFGVYIWNVGETHAVVALLKRIQPKLVIVLGGPEVSYETELQPICTLADHVLCGEADLAFARLCRDILDGVVAERSVRTAELPELDSLRLPYALYTPEDLAHRIVYVEASRGCPFHCEFCLSSLDIPVRQFPLDRLLEEFRSLLDRGLRHFKFVDRTFNLNVRVSRAILEFFLNHLESGMLLHFELIPDRLPDDLRALVVRFPPGTLQFEVGIQTFNPEVAERIRRRQDYTLAEANLAFLRRETGVHLHVDLIVGLPGEDLQSFAAGFDRLLQLNPQEIQIGMLKRLRGTPISRHDEEWQMLYSQDPPYEILCNRSLDFPTMQRLRRFARTWDLTANSGRFLETTPLLWRQRPSAFRELLNWSDWLHHEAGRLHAIALDRLAALLCRYLVEEAGCPAERVLESLQSDYSRSGLGRLPMGVTHPARPPATKSGSGGSRKRQDRHLRPAPGLPSTRHE